MRGAKGAAGVKKKVSDMTKAIALSLLLHGVLFCALSLLTSREPVLSTPVAPLVVSLDTGRLVSADSPAVSIAPAGSSAAAPPSPQMPVSQPSPVPDAAAEAEPLESISSHAETDPPSPAPASAAPVFDPVPGGFTAPLTDPGAETRSADPASIPDGGSPVSPAGASREPRYGGSDPSQRALISGFLERAIRDRLTYPAAARRMGSQGIVVVTILISADGDLKGIDLASSSGSGILDESALRLVDSLFPVPYKPGTELTLTIRVVYRLT